jgi:hypothetical protein
MTGFALSQIKDVRFAQAFWAEKRPPMMDKSTEYKV